MTQLLTKGPHSVEGPSGTLETLYVPSLKNTDTTAILCHPHPMFGGTMHNKVVYTLHKSLHNLHMNTVRFNFRGVGKSAGHFDQGFGEIQDALAIWQWIKHHQSQDNIVIAGFSFGAYIGAQLALKKPPKLLISIAPPLERFNFRNVTDITCPWLVIQGLEDDVVNPNGVIDWSEQSGQQTLVKIANADHFFHGKLQDLSTELTKYTGFLLE